MKKVILPLALLALAAAIYEPAPYPVGYQMTAINESTGPVTLTWDGSNFVNEAGGSVHYCANWSIGHSCFGPPPPAGGCVSDLAHTGRGYACTHYLDYWIYGFSGEQPEIPTIREEDVPDWVPFIEDDAELHGR